MSDNTNNRELEAPSEPEAPPRLQNINMDLLLVDSDSDSDDNFSIAVVEVPDDLAASARKRRRPNTHNNEDSSTITASSLTGYDEVFKSLASSIASLVQSQQLVAKIRLEELQYRRKEQLHRRRKALCDDLFDLRVRLQKEEDTNLKSFYEEKIEERRAEIAQLEEQIEKLIAQLPSYQPEQPSIRENH